MGPVNSRVYEEDNSTSTASTGAYTLKYNVLSEYPNNTVTWEIDKKRGSINPILYFKYIKSKFKMLEKPKILQRLQSLEKAFDKAVENGQDVLAQKFLDTLTREAAESAIYAKGVKKYVERADLVKYKNRIRDGHISDTAWKDFTRVIPKNVIKKKREVEDVFDSFEIWHYWNEEEQQKIAKKQKMSPEERAKMRDPVLFGMVKGSDRMYFIAEWDDDFCDLSFDEIADVVGSGRISKKPSLDTD